MKVLMLGPGEPNLLNSGLGTVAENIAKELNGLLELQIVEAAAMEQTEATIERIVEEKNRTFSELSLHHDLARVSIKTSLPNYFYDTQTAADLLENPHYQSSMETSLADFTEQIIAHYPTADYQLVYAHDWTTIDAAMQLQALHGIPFVLHIHSLDYDRSAGQGKSWVFDLEKKGMEAAAAVVAVSKYHAGIMQKEYGISADKIKVVYPAATLPKSVKKEQKFTEELVLFVGRLSGQKGPRMFMEIAAAVLNKRLNTRFVMAGTGELMQQLIESGANAGLHDKFHFTGYLNATDLAALYQMADVYCMPSISEPFGLTAIEAASYELPLVLSKQSGAAEMLPEALLVDKQDTEAFALAIVNILDKPELQKKMVSANKKAVSTRTWSAVGRELYGLFENILS